jgi:hypothetical protein
MHPDKLQLHFCTDQSSWRYLVPTLLDIHESPFHWETCQFSQGYTLAHSLLLSSAFSFVPIGCEEYVGEWIALHGGSLQQRFDIYWWKNAGADEGCVNLPELASSVNGFLFDLKSRFPLRSLRSLLKERALHPSERVRLRQIIVSAARVLKQMGWETSSLPALAPPTLESSYREMGYDYKQILPIMPVQ